VQTTFNIAYENGHYAFGDFYFGPSVDGEVIRQLPSQEFKQGHFTRVPLFVNHNALEGYAFSDQNMEGKEDALRDVKTLFPNARESFISRLFDLYPASDFNSTFLQRARWFGDFIIDCPTYYMATAVSDYGSPVYKLYFAAGSDLHGAVAPFVKSRNLNGAYPRHLWLLLLLLTLCPKGWRTIPLLPASCAITTCRSLYPWTPTRSRTPISRARTGRRTWVSRMATFRCLMSQTR
jgi:hypothetical protein